MSAEGADLLTVPPTNALFMSIELLVVKRFEDQTASLLSSWLHSSAAAAAFLICVENKVLIENIFVNTFHTVLFYTHLAILLVKSHNLSNENEHLVTEMSLSLTSNKQNSLIKTI